MAISTTILIVDRDTMRGRALARRVESTGSTAIVARHLADAFVHAATGKTDLAIVALGALPSTHASLTALRALAPETEILFTGDSSGDDTIESILDDDALYRPAISWSRIEALLCRRMAERKRRRVDEQRSPRSTREAP